MAYKKIFIFISIILLQVFDLRYVFSSNSSSETGKPTGNSKSSKPSTGKQCVGPMYYDTNPPEVLGAERKETHQKCFLTTFIVCAVVSQKEEERCKKIHFELRNENGEESSEFSTNENGEFKINLPEGSQYELKVLSPGLSSKRRISVTAGETIHVNLTADSAPKGK